MFSSCALSFHKNIQPLVNKLLRRFSAFQVWVEPTICKMLAEYSNHCTMLAEYSNHCTMLAECSNQCTILAEYSNHWGTRPPSVRPTSIIEVLGLIPTWNSFLHPLLVNHHLHHSFHAIPPFVYSHFFHSSIPRPTFHSNKIIPKKVVYEERDWL